MMARIVMVLLSLLTACGVDLPDTVANGDPAPSFASVDQHGRPVSFPDDFRGKVVALRFWADWCPYCGPEMRAIEPVYQRLRGRGLEVVAINAGQDRATVNRFLAATPLSYPVLLDPEVKAVGLYGVVGLPQTFLIDRAGVVRGRIAGEATAEVFERQVSALLR